MAFANYVISGTTPASASAAVLGTIAPDYTLGANCVDLSEYDTCTVYAELVGATGGTLDAIVETSPDGGTTWYEFGRFAQLASAAAAVVKRVNAIPAATITTIGKVTTGTATTSVLTGDAGFNTSWNDRLRVRCIAGASTSAGAALKLHFAFGNDD